MKGAEGSALAVATLLADCGVGVRVSHGPEPADYMAAEPVGSYEDVPGLVERGPAGCGEPERRREGR